MQVFLPIQGMVPTLTPQCKSLEIPSHWGHSWEFMISSNIIRHNFLPYPTRSLIPPTAPPRWGSTHSLTLPSPPGGGIPQQPMDGPSHPLTLTFFGKFKSPIFFWNDKWSNPTWPKIATNVGQIHLRHSQIQVEIGRTTMMSFYSMVLF